MAMTNRTNMGLNFFEPLNKFEKEGEKNQAAYHKQECLHNNVLYNYAKKVPGPARSLIINLKPSRDNGWRRIGEQLFLSGA